MDSENRRFWIFFLIVFLLGIYFFVLGESGLIERMVLEKEIVISEERNRRLLDEQIALKKTLKLLKNGNISPVEFARTGYIEPGARIVFFRGKPADPVRDRAERAENGIEHNISHLRIIWVVVSSMIVLFLFIRKNRHNGPL